MTRTITSVYILPPHASARTIDDAIAFLASPDEFKPDTPFTRYEVGVRYSNGDEIRGQFADKLTAIAFLRGMR